MEERSSERVSVDLKAGSEGQRGRGVGGVLGFLVFQYCCKPAVRSCVVCELRGVRDTRGKVFGIFDEDPAVSIQRTDRVIFIADKENHISGIRVNELTCKFKRLDRWKRLFNRIILLLRLPSDPVMREYLGERHFNDERIVLFHLWIPK